MSRTIARRVAALERRHGIARGEFYVVALPDGMDRDAALTKLRLTPSPSDMVVLVARFFGEADPALLTRCALAD